MTNNTENAKASEEAGEAGDHRNHPSVLNKVVVSLIVGGEGDHRPPANSNGVEYLMSCQDPDLSWQKKERRGRGSWEGKESGALWREKCEPGDHIISSNQGKDSI